MAYEDEEDLNYDDYENEDEDIHKITIKIIITMMMIMNTMMITMMMIFMRWIKNEQNP